MRLKLIKKLCESTNREDAILGMAYLVKYISKRGISKFTKKSFGVKECYGLMDINPNIPDEWFLAVHRRKKFCINTAGRLDITDKSYIVYSFGKRYENITKDFKKEIIYEE